MSERTLMKDGSIETFEDPNRLRITKPSFRNVRRNLSTVATQGAITLNKIRNIIPEPPEQLVKGVDWAYKNHPMGIADQGAQLLGDDVSRFLTDKGAPKGVGTAAALAIGLATPGIGSKVQGIKGLDKARKLAIKPKATRNINLFPPNQTLQTQLATVSPNNLSIKPNISNVIDPSKPLQIASNLQPTPRVGQTTYGSLRTLVKQGDPESLVKARKILESGWGGKLSKKNTLVSIDKLVGTDEGKVILNRLMKRSESIDKRFAKYYEKLGRKAKSTEISQGELYDVAAKNLYDASELIYGQKGARKYLANITKWFTKDEWHHIFGNKEAGEFLLSQVAQDPVVAVNLFKKMDNLGLFSSGISKNIAVMKQAPHKEIHRWYVKHGFQGGAADFGELGRELGEQIAKGKADVNDLFRMLELHSDFNKHVRGLIKAGKFGKYGDEVKLLDEIPEGVGKALRIGGYRAKGPSKQDAFYR